MVGVIRSLENVGRDSHVDLNVKEGSIQALRIPLCSPSLGLIGPIRSVSSHVCIQEFPSQQKRISLVSMKTQV